MSVSKDFECSSTVIISQCSRNGKKAGTTTARPNPITGHTTDTRRTSSSSQNCGNSRLGKVDNINSVPWFAFPATQVQVPLRYTFQAIGVGDDVRISNPQIQSRALPLVIPV